MTQLASDGLWTWFNEGVAHWRDGSLYVGHLTSNGRANVARWHSATGIVQERIVSIAGADDHNNPGMTFLDDGKLFLGIPGHPGSLAVYRGMVPESISTNKSAITSISSQSYSRPHQIADTSKTLYVFCREDLNPAAGRQNLFITSTDGGLTWSGKTHYFADGTKTPYGRSVLHSNGLRIDFLLTNDSGDDPATNLYHFYCTFDASGNRSWFKSDGTQIGTGDSELPLTPADVTLVHTGDATYGCWQSSGGLQWIGGVLYANVVNFSGTNGGTHTYYRYALSGGSWTGEVISNGGDHTPNWIVPDADLTNPGYMPGHCLDPTNADVAFVCRKYGNGDSRLEEWTRGGGGTWSKTADISGNTSSINARPYPVLNTDGTVKIVYFRGTYTTYNNYSTAVHTYPDVTVTTSYTPQAKPASIDWQADLAPAGVNHYHALVEGTGTTVADAVPTTGKNGTFVGSPSWATGSYGPQVSGFTTSNYIAIDPTTQPVGTGVYPFWSAVMFTGNSTTSEQYPLSFGRSTSGTPSAATLRINTSAAGNVGCFQRSDANVEASANASGGTPNDGGTHVLMWVHWNSAGDRRLYWDGIELTAPSEVALGTTTLDRMTIGALRRSTVSGAFTGGAVIAVASGQGDAPSPDAFAHDWLSGEFAAIRSASTPLTAPTLTEVSHDDNSVTLSWDDATGGTAPYTYDIEQSPSGAGTWSDAATGVTSPHEVTGLSSNTAYDFRLQVTDSA